MPTFTANSHSFSYSILVILTVRRHWYFVALFFIAFLPFAHEKRSA
ncbi:MAG: hypothetical protein OSJ28_11460 [Desulfovibrio sp.]|nr:hypothetical protein [Desulfovibrio sp.]